MMSQDKSVEAIGPDCLNCWKKNICPQMEEGKFCGQWQSAEPKPKETDPNEKWNQGEDVGGWI